MTPRQKELARHATGLDRCKASYRNFYNADPGTPDYDEWIIMQMYGLAISRSPTSTGGVTFHLTRMGAEIALEPGESLDPEDFPS